MKVAFCSPIRMERDGVGAYARALCSHLSRLCEVEHFPLDNRCHSRSWFRQMAEEINRFEVFHLEHNFGYFRIPLYPFREGFRDFLRRVRIPRMVVYHELFDRIPVRNPLAFPNGPKEKAVNAFLYAGIALVRPLADILWLPGFNREIFEIPERVVVHTEFRGGIVRRYAPDARLTVIPHPVYAPAKPGMENIDIPFDRKDIVLTVFGFLEPRKDYKGVLEALGRLPRNYKLMIAGGSHAEGKEESMSVFREIKTFIRRFHLEDRVHLTGFCPDASIPRLMAATDVVVAPFLEDHSSGSVNMGLAYSRPIVAYRTKLTEEMNRNGAGLVLVEGQDQLVSALYEAGGSPEWSKKVSRAGDGYRERYGFEAASVRIRNLYDEMLAEVSIGR